ncbi:MAG: alanine/glycine:cation symporter family protein [Candidatus Krumholzibacteriia bacterium]
METVDRVLAVAVDYAWGVPLIILLVVGGLILTIIVRFLPLLGARHAIALLRGRYDDEHDPGQISHFQALSTALSSTIGMGNIGGVAIAITQGGPGAVFWMWVAAFVGMTTKYFTCTLAVLYRGRDSLGVLQGGPMYYIEVGLGRPFRFLAIFFSICGMIGCLAMFQTNQMAEILTAAYDLPGWITGLVCVFLVTLIIIGGLQRIAAVASRIVPSMCLLYVVGVGIIIVKNLSGIPAIFGQIFHDAFTGTAAAGGVAGIAFRQVVQTGVKRAAFSNEAGIGTAPMAHGAAKTAEPVREGLVAMIGPFIDTIVVCTLTALTILSAGNWQVSDVEGTSLTIQAFEASMGVAGKLGLILVVVMFGLSTMIGFSYYGKKCFSYLFGAQRGRIYDVFYIVMLFLGAVWSVDIVVNLLDTAFALMALPNMIATLILAPKVLAASRDYFRRMGIGEHGKEGEYARAADSGLAALDPPGVDEAGRSTRE